MRKRIRCLVQAASTSFLLGIGLLSAAAQAQNQTASSPASHAANPSCRGTLYLTFDTGSMAAAQHIAETLRKHRVPATFFLANERTIQGDYTLDNAWAPYWKSLVADGHAFGSHTFDHVYFKGDAADGKVKMRPQFGSRAGQVQTWDAAQVCQEIRRPQQRFQQLTGKAMDALWRAPGGYISPRLLQASQQCGVAHIAWADAGFLGDELPSEKYPNTMLLAKALKNLKDGDITMAHLGIWSRKDPWAQGVLEPLIVGLKEKGFCFATLRTHPQLARALAQPISLR